MALMVFLVPFYQDALFPACWVPNYSHALLCPHWPRTRPCSRLVGKGDRKRVTEVSRVRGSAIKMGGWTPSSWSVLLVSGLCRGRGQGVGPQGSVRGRGIVGDEGAAAPPAQFCSKMGAVGPHPSQSPGFLIRKMGR